MAAPARTIRNAWTESVGHVLVVDDAADNRRLVVHCLRSIGVHSIAEAREGPSALHAILETLPDLVILDMDLPLLDGYEVLRQVRRTSGRAAHVPVIVLTAAVGIDTRLRCMEAGATDFLAKPLRDPDALRTLVRRTLAALLSPARVGICGASTRELAPRNKY